MDALIDKGGTLARNLVGWRPQFKKCVAGGGGPAWCTNDFDVTC